MRWNLVIGIATAVCALVQLAMTAVGYFNPDGLFAGYGDMLFTARLLSWPCFSAIRYCAATTGREFHWSSFCHYVRLASHSWCPSYSSRTTGFIHVSLFRSLAFSPSVFWARLSSCSCIPTCVVISPGHTQPSNQSMKPTAPLRSNHSVLA